MHKAEVKLNVVKTLLSYVIKTTSVITNSPGHCRPGPRLALPGRRVQHPVQLPQVEDHGGCRETASS